MKLYNESKKIRIHLPSLPTIRDLLRKANDWMNRTKAFRNQEEYLFLDELETLISKGEQMPILFKELPFLQTHAQDARKFRIKVAKLFLRKNSIIELPQVSETSLAIQSPLDSTFKCLM